MEGIVCNGFFGRFYKGRLNPVIDISLKVDENLNIMHIAVKKLKTAGRGLYPEAITFSSTDIYDVPRGDVLSFTIIEAFYRDGIIGAISDGPEADPSIIPPHTFIEVSFIFGIIAGHTGRHVPEGMFGFLK